MDNEYIKDAIYNCIEIGEFTLSSGKPSAWKCEILKIHNKLLLPLLYMLPEQSLIIGIELGGAILATNYCMKINKPAMSGILTKKGELFLDSNNTYYTQNIVLLDDVVTTEKTIRNSLKHLKRHNVSVNEIYCIMDRRDNEEKRLDIKSVLTKYDLGLE